MALVYACVIESRSERRWLYLGGIAVPLVSQLHWVVMSNQLNYPGDVGRDGIEVGQWLYENAAEDALLAVNVAGTIPYYSQLETIDTLGLNDERIAHRNIEDMGAGWAGHEKGDGAYVLSREPDYIIFASSRGGKTPRFRGDWELFESEEFHRLYDLHQYKMPSGRKLRIWVREEQFGGAGLYATPQKVIREDLRGTISKEEVLNPKWIETSTWWD